MSAISETAVIHSKASAKTFMPVRFRPSHKEVAYKAFCMFVIGCVVGFVVETLFCLVTKGTVECRSSLVIGPFNTVYGVGALALYLCLGRLGKKNIVQLFLVGAVLGTVVEFLCSFLQEVVFGTISWDYSNMPLNIGGRVCILFTVFWGLLAILWAKLLQPLLEKLIALIPHRIARPLTCCLLVFFILNITVSVAAVARWGMRVDGVPATNIITTWIDRLLPNSFVEQIYPNMIFPQ